MKGIRGTAVLLPIVLVLAASSRAAEPIDETERWVPSVAITSGVVAQGAGASVSTADITIPTWDPFVCPPSPCPVNVTQPGRPSDRGNSILFAPFVGGQIELMTPGIQALIGRPRGFFQVGFDVSFGVEYDTALEGDLGDLGDDLRRPIFIPTVIEGQGSETALSILSPIFTAGAGIAFTAEIWGRRVRLKPSFQWMRQQVEMSGRTNVPILLSYDGSNDSVYQMVYLKADKTLVWHGIGPGLELEVDAVRTGPITVSLAFYVNAYYLLGNKDIEMTATDMIGPFPTAKPPLPNMQPISSTYTYEQKDWSFRGGVALRFRFLPE
ncbi:MAG: hypothetical protein VCC68_01220 [Myxococcota bacterium]